MASDFYVAAEFLDDVSAGFFKVTVAEADEVVSVDYDICH